MDNHNNCKITNPQNLSTKGFADLDVVTRTGIEPMIPPWKGDVLTTWPTGQKNGSGSRIWTNDTLGMNQVL